MNFLKKIQGKPKRFRQRIFWLTFLVSGFFVVLFWFVSFDRSLPKLAESSRGIEQSLSPLSEIKKEAPSLGKAIKAAIKSFFEENETTQKTEEENSQAGDASEFQQGEKPQLEKIKPARLPESR